MSPYVVPDHELERNLPTSLTPTFWGALTIVSFDSLDTNSPQSSAIPGDHLVAQLSTSSKGSENTITPVFNPVDLPPVRHRRLYFDDGNITFCVQGILYRLHRSLLCRGSRKFEDLISQLSAQQETSESTSPTTSLTIPLDDVRYGEFDAFLSILYPENYNTLEKRTFEEWSAILDLSTRWGFTSIRDLAIRCTKPDPLDRLILARKHAIEEWILPALLELCERPEPLSLEEACLIDFEDVVLVGSVRQNVRSPTLTVNSTGIGNCVRAWMSGKPYTPQDSPNNLFQTHLPQSRSLSPPTEHRINVFTQPAPPINDGGWGAASGGKKKGKRR